MNRQIYKMTIADASDSITFYLLEVPIVEEDVGGTATNTTIDGNVYTDYMWLKKQWKQKWSIMCKDEYTKLHDIFERQFTNAEVPNLKIFYGDNIHTDGNAEGQSFQITNDSETYDGEILDFSLYGNTTQETLSGKNLFSGSNPLAITGYQDITLDKQLDTGTYTLSCSNITSTGSPTVCLMGFVYTDNTSVLAGMSVSAKKITITAYKTIAKLRIYANADYASSQGITTTFTDLMIESGSTATDYEKYVGGIPAPNPDFPMPVENVSGAQMVKVCGKNLLDFDDFLTSGGATYTKDGANYSITAIGNIIQNRYKLEVVDGESYTLSCSPYTQSTSNARLQIFKDGTVIGIIYLGSDGQTHSYTFTAAAGSSYALNLTYSSPLNTPIVASKVQLEKNDQATNYEPYQGQSYEINLGGSNLCPNEFEQGGISATTGANNSDTAIRTTNYATVKENTTYTASTNKGTNIAIRYYKSDGTFIGSGTTASASGNTFTTPALTARVRFVITNTTDTSQNFMLNEGPTALPYAPYTTYAHELCKIGTYQDYIYKSGDKWYKHAEVGKVVLDGSEVGWNAANNGFLLSYGATSPFYGIALGQPSYESLCDHFTVQPDGTTWTGRGKCGFNSSGVFWCMHTDTSITTAADFKTWLSSNNTTLYIPLATPTDTEITDSELVGQLDALLEGSLYKGLNNVFLIPSAGADGTMTMEYRIIYEKETIVQDTTPVKLDLTDGGIINACLCRQNVQVIMRETKDSSES